MSIKLYEVNEKYVSYLVPHAPHLFHNKKPSQNNRRKYIGVILEVNGFSYFAPLSSFKEKHKHMQETIDFIKIKDYAVININNMFPVPLNLVKNVDFSKERNPKYKQLLQAEYRVIKSKQDLLKKNAKTVYQLKIKEPNSSLAKRCNDFQLLEKLCNEYNK